MQLQCFLPTVWAVLTSATSYSVSVFSPGTEIDGSLLNAAASGFYAGISSPATYCPSDVGPCPPSEGTLVLPGMQGMAVAVPGGQSIYVHPNGQIKYTAAHSTYMPPDSYTGGWFNKTVVCDCAPTVEVLDFLANDGSNVGGVMLCPDVQDFLTGTGASYQLYAKTPSFNLTNCVEALGLTLTESQYAVGGWQYM